MNNTMPVMSSQSYLANKTRFFEEFGEEDEEDNKRTRYKDGYYREKYCIQYYYHAL